MAGQSFSGTSLTIAATGSVALAASTLTDISLSASISPSVNNIINFFWTDSAQAQTVTLDIGNVFFGQGASAPATFDPPDPASDLRICQRYYNKSFPTNTPPVRNIGSVTGAVSWSAVLAGAQFGNYLVIFPVEMMKTPAITTYNPLAANAQAVTSGHGDCTNTGANPTTKAVLFFAQATSTTVANESISVHWSASARL